MAKSSLADFALFINRQIEVQRKIEVYLCRVDALLAVCLMTANFYDVPQITLHHYFSVVSDIIEELIRIHQINLGQLMQQEQ